MVFSRRPVRGEGAKLYGDMQACPSEADRLLLELVMEMHRICDLRHNLKVDRITNFSEK